MNDPILGIDLGTTNSAVGIVDAGFPILLADAHGRRITPSAVYLGSDGNILVGHEALRMRAHAPQRVITSIKRLIGTRTAEMVDDFPFPVTPSAVGLPLVHGHSPEQISAKILGELKRIAEWRLEQRVSKAVITVPAYFNDGQRAATIRAGELAGLEVVRILNEPTAAALAFGLDQLADRARIAVYDLGGGTFDLSILEIQDGIFQVLATHGDTHLGGDDIDRRILAAALAKSSAPTPPADAVARLLEESGRVKHALSDDGEAVFRAPFYDGKNSLEVAFSAADLENFVGHLVERTIRHCRQALADAECSPADLDAVVLVGGSTRLPAVRAAVAAAFACEPNLSQHPDEAVALGATIQAGVMSGALRKLVLLDVTPLSLGIETYGGLMNVIIPRNTSIPCKAGEKFTNSADHQSSIRLRVLQGEREMARDNWELGACDVPFHPAPKGRARVGVQFAIDANGILEVLARDLHDATDTKLTIDHAAVNVSDSAVEEMVSASVTHAFTDMAERIFTEARLKAEELLAALSPELIESVATVEEKSAIEIAAAAVRKALDGTSPNPLKSAVQELDRVTEAMAARLVEQAMDEAIANKFGPETQ